MILVSQLFINTYVMDTKFQYDIVPVLFAALVCLYIIYCKIPKFSDVRKLCCNLPNIKKKRPYFVKKMLLE